MIFLYVFCFTSLLFILSFFTTGLLIHTETQSMNYILVGGNFHSVLTVSASLAKQTNKKYLLNSYHVGDM